jgi:hypothetical protein
MVLAKVINSLNFERSQTCKKAHDEALTSSVGIASWSSERRVVESQVWLMDDSERARSSVPLDIIRFVVELHGGRHG